MNRLITLILPLALFLSSASCKKDSTKIESGFTCKIDGKRWRTYSSDFKKMEDECHITKNGESIFIKAVNTNSLEHFSILVESPGKIVTEGVYALNSDRYFYGSYRAPDVGDLITGNGYEGQIEIIKIDKENSRIIGKFNYTCHSDLTKQSRTITEGQFNIMYYNF
ncbi:hypothetical protein EON73_02905 [bacterium]|nr:MAG: hypothetical protein EON73_02905 [bacterium]